MHPEWLNVQPRVGIAWDPKGDGRTSVRAGYGMNSNFIAGEFYFDASQAPPFGLEQRLVNPGAVFPRRSMARCRQDQPVSTHTGAFTSSRRTHYSSRCRTTSRRHAFIAGTWVCSDRLATTWECRPVISETT